MFIIICGFKTLRQMKSNITKIYASPTTQELIKMTIYYVARIRDIYNIINYSNHRRPCNKRIYSASPLSTPISQNFFISIRDV